MLRAAYTNTLSSGRLIRPLDSDRTRRLLYHISCLYTPTYMWFWIKIMV